MKVARDVQERTKRQNGRCPLVASRYTRPTRRRGFFNMRWLYSLTAACAVVQVILVSLAIAGTPGVFVREGEMQMVKTQDVVTWDKHSLFVKGERVMIFSGEFHPWRLPVPSLWLDIFQKIKALGYNTVSFYTNWALLEGEPGVFRAEGVFGYDEFFKAATDAGIWLIARPGPYINAEASGGGFPGWLQRLSGALRTDAPDYLNATNLYVASVAAIIAKAQITNGGPIILYQPENEYSTAAKGVDFPDASYMQYVIDQAKNASIIIPTINNDGSSKGRNAPGTGDGEVDIYGYDSYPVGFTCSKPDKWPEDGFKKDMYATHMKNSPDTPQSILEFQGGAPDTWGGTGVDSCVELFNEEVERVFFKNNFAAGVTVQNIYMAYGGTNWGNLGFATGYTSYDYGAAIAEDRTITREKYSEVKLQAQFLKVSPAYLTATPGAAKTQLYTDTTDLYVTPVVASVNSTRFYVIRHTLFDSRDKTEYTLTLETSVGVLSIPQMGGTLLLNGRDSKIHVTDYDVGGTNLLYSTAEILTWKKFENNKVLILYGGLEESHEAAIVSAASPSLVEGDGVKMAVEKDSANGTVVLHWDTSSTRRIVQVGDMFIYLLDRNSAYNYWVPDISADSSVIVKAGYLIRTAATKGSTLQLTGDFNTSTPIEVIGASPSLKKLTMNGDDVEITKNEAGVWSGNIEYEEPSFELPNFRDLTWYSIDALPELQAYYDDSDWVNADHEDTTNSFRDLTTPTSLYSSDYGFHAGYLIYRGHFTANGDETTISIKSQGGNTFGVSAWLNDTNIGSYVGSPGPGNYNMTSNLTSLISGDPYVLTILIDTTGYDQNQQVGSDTMKIPRGIVDYSFPGHDDTDISWKLTGNLGGEQYIDKVRGPLNEGGLYPERQGWHQPSPPSSDWSVSSPITDGLTQPGVIFYTTTFPLSMPSNWDIPLAFNFTTSSHSEDDDDDTPSSYRVQLYINGWQFGKYISNIGPQTKFPVPQGILDYEGTNTVAISLWALQEEGARIEGLELLAGRPVRTGMRKVELSPMPGWKERKGAY